MTTKIKASDLRIDARDPESCQSLDDIRQGIDAIDARIIALLGLRLRYVLNAAKFKASEAAIPAPERVAAMLPKRRDWSEDAGLSPDFIVPLFAQIIQWFIQQQVKHWRDTSQ